MSNYDNTNSGALFKNDRKETSNHPDYKGSINVDGVDYWLSAWIKPMKNDPEKRYMSISVKQKEGQAPVQRKAQNATPVRGQANTGRGASGFDDLDDGLPPF